MSPTVVSRLPRGIQKYDQFCDGQVWRFVEGEDCNSIYTVVGGMGKTAKRLGLKLRTAIKERERVVFVQTYQPGDPPPPCVWAPSGDH